MSAEKIYHVILTAFISNSWEVIRMYESKKIDSLLTILSMKIASTDTKEIYEEFKKYLKDNSITLKELKENYKDYGIKVTVKVSIEKKLSNILVYNLRLDDDFLLYGENHFEFIDNKFFKKKDIVYLSDNILGVGDEKYNN